VFIIDLSETSVNVS